MHQSSEISSMQNSYTQFSTIQQEQALLASEHTNTRSDVDERPSAGVIIYYYYVLYPQVKDIDFNLNSE
jgi:hypothetical protein